MNSKNYNNKPKPFCKVCFDAGKTDTAHFVRSSPDPKSKVTCPTLLALECRYCAQVGHTVKYCSVLKKNNKDKERFDRQTRVVNTVTPIVAPTIKNNNMFAALEQDSDDDNEDRQIHTEQLSMPPLCHAPVAQINNTQLNNNSNTWATIAAKPPTIQYTVSDDIHLQQQNQIQAQAHYLQQQVIQYEIQHNEYGEQLYARIAAKHRLQAGKIVGLLLELEHELLEQLLHDSDLLDANVAECITILDAIERKPYTTPAAVSAWDDDSW